MPSVRLLPPDLINKIAAGEVVVRPASAIKELLENSLDAGATRIEIDVTHGCRDIVVTDNGCGMDREDALAALERHATSKIRTLDDLRRLRTNGFRGEALPSMASVARMRILTRPASQPEGTLIEVEGGALERVAAHAAPEGTRIELRDLFYNVPARRKFLKSPLSELNQILGIVTRLALARPDVSFTMHVDGRQRVQARGPVAPLERIAQVLGRQLADGLLEVPGPAGGQPASTVRVRGYIGRPAVASKSRSRQYYFANQRPITHRRLPSVVQQAYRGLLMVDRHAALVLFIDIDPDDLDVNVHPTKEEVRFADEDLVCSVVYRSVQSALASVDLTPRLHLNEETPSAAQLPAPQKPPGAPPFLPARMSAPPAYQLDAPALRDLRQTWTGSPPPRLQPDFLTSASPKRAAPASAGPTSTSAPNGLPRRPSAPEPLAAEVRQPERESPLPAEPVRAIRADMPMVEALPRHLAMAREAEIPFFQGPPPRVLGQVALTYIVAECADGALLIDQHAAHERLLFHRFVHRPHVGVQPLLIPVAIDLPAPLLAAADALIAPLAATGIEIEHFGGSSYIIRSLPADLPHIDAARLLLELLSDFEGERPSAGLADAREKVAARLACRAAVKAGQELSMEEMNALLRDMRLAQLPFTCPHGRPTMMLLTRHQLDRQFGREG